MCSQLALTAFLFLLVSLLGAQLKVVRSWEDKDFFSYCPPSQCSTHGPEIRFPFHLDSINNTSSLCGVPCMKLSCSGQDTILDNRYLGRPYKVTAIDYKDGTLTIIPLADLDGCPLLKSVPLNLPRFSYYPDANWSSCNIYRWDSAALISCSTELKPTRIPAVAAADAIAGPIACLTNTTHFSYLVSHRVPTYLILDCEVVSNGPIPIPMFFSSDGYKFRESAERILNFAYTTIDLMYYTNPVAEYCINCEIHGRRCAYSSQRNQTFCMGQGTLIYDHTKYHPHLLSVSFTVFSLQLTHECLVSTHQKPQKTLAVIWDG